LHIIFNALEEVISALPEWPAMERELSAACHVASEPSSQGVILAKMYSDASVEERAKVKAFNARLLSWRWESLFDVVSQWMTLYPSLKHRWRAEAFADAKSKHVSVVTAALASDWHALFGMWLYVFSQAVCEQASWMEGCWCHGDLLAGQRNRWRRQQVFPEGQDWPGFPGTCPWKGRRLPALAVGRVETMAQSIANASTAEFTAAMLSALPAHAQRLAQIDLQCKRAMAEILRQKFEPFGHVPYSIAGAFAGYCGYPWSVARKAVQDAVAEFESIPVSRRDAVSCALLQADTAVGVQLREFAESDRDLADFPDAFLHVRARAFALMTERRTEGQHALVKHHALRGLRFAGPAIIAARKRQDEVEQMLHNHMDFVCSMWRSHHLWRELLRHVVDPADLPNMPMAKRVARLYAYDKEDHYADVSQMCEHNALFNRALADARAPMPQDAALTDMQAQLVAFLKQCMPEGCLVSFPRELHRKALGLVPAAAPEPKADMDAPALQAALTLSPRADMVWPEQVLLSVVDTRAERRTTVRMDHVVRKRSLLHVVCMSDVVWASDGSSTARVHGAKGQRQVLDLAAIAQGAEFKAFCEAAWVWKPDCSGLMLELRPCQAAAAMPLHLPDIVMDEQLLSEAFEAEQREDELALACRTSEQQLQLQVEAGACPLSREDHRTMLALLERKAVGEANACYLLQLEYWTSKTLSFLEAQGIVASKQDEFADTLVWLTDSVKFAPGMSISDPQPMLVHAESTTLKGRTTTKITLMLMLFSNGWRLPGAREAKPEWQKPASRVLRLVPQCFSRPKSYFRALLLLPLLFDRGLQRLSHHGPAAYYDAIIRATDMAVFNALSDRDVRTYTVTKEEAARAAREALEMPEDAECVEEALEPAAADAAGDPVGAICIPDEAYEIPPVPCRAPHLPNVRVLYDRFTHQSGKLRCFVSCPEAGGKHGSKCRRYTFVSAHASRRAAEAWLLAWASLASSTRDMTAHVAADPCAAAVAAMQVCQAGHL
jgi:hypothetical protein